MDIYSYHNLIVLQHLSFRSTLVTITGSTRQPSKKAYPLQIRLLCSTLVTDTGRTRASSEKACPTQNPGVHPLRFYDPSALCICNRRAYMCLYFYRSKSLRVHKNTYNIHYISFYDPCALHGDIWRDDGVSAAQH